MSICDTKLRGFRLRDCIKNLQQKQSVYIEDFA
jgi:hypothetical protein